MTDEMKWWDSLSLEDKLFYISKYYSDISITDISEENIKEMYKKQKDLISL